MISHPSSPATLVVGPIGSGPRMRLASALLCARSHWRPSRFVRSLLAIERDVLKTIGGPLGEGGDEVMLGLLHR